MPRDQRPQHTEVLLNESQLNEVLDQMAQSLLPYVKDAEPLSVLGLATRGIPLAEQIAARLTKLLGKTIENAQIDATFYRDDLHTKRGFKHPSLSAVSQPQTLQNTHVVLVDDVFYTGRSARAALNALMDLGRPKSVRFAVLVDRDQRELPIRPDVSGIVCHTEPGEEVRVCVKPVDESNEVLKVYLGENGGEDNE